MLDLLREIGHVEEVPVVYPFRGRRPRGKGKSAKKEAAKNLGLFLAASFYL